MKPWKCLKAVLKYKEEKMANINSNFLNLSENYLFSEIARRVNAYKQANPDKDVISLGIGDVTLPLADAVVEEMKQASTEMGKAETFKGYGPEKGYDFLVNEIARQDYNDRGVDISAGEIFISDGAKSDCGNIGDIFSVDSVTLVSEPAYPVYVDSSIMSGRPVKFVKCSAENGFMPEPPDFSADLIFLCSPNNPTGSVMGRELLKKWVDYALKNNAVIIFDSAYEAYISDDTLPHTIYEIEGAKKCAIEIRSFSKTAGFTGVRCGYTVVPLELTGKDENGNEVSLNKLWNRRQSTKFNGASYISERAAHAVYSSEGRAQCRNLVSYYMNNAKVIKKAVDELGWQSTGGDNSPYIWLKCPSGMTSWEFFDKLLTEANVVGTPGSGFGQAGEGWFRLTSFGNADRTVEAVNRIKRIFG